MLCYKKLVWEFFRQNANIDSSQRLSLAVKGNGPTYPRSSVQAKLFDQPPSQHLAESSVMRNRDATFAIREDLMFTIPT